MSNTPETTAGGAVDQQASTEGDASAVPTTSVAVSAPAGSATSTTTPADRPDVDDPAKQTTTTAPAAPTTPVAPKIFLPHEEEEYQSFRLTSVDDLYEHLGRLRDAVNEDGTITENSNLVTLYQRSQDKGKKETFMALNSDRYQSKLYGYCEARALLKLPDGTRLKDGDVINGYQVVVTFPKLFSRPAVRVEFRMFDESDSSNTSYLKFHLDFPFNIVNHGKRGIDSDTFKLDTKCNATKTKANTQEMSFVANYALPHGFNLTPEQADRLKKSGMRHVYDAAKLLINPREPQSLEFELYPHDPRPKIQATNEKWSASKKKKQAMYSMNPIYRAMLEWLPGCGDHTLPSILAKKQWGYFYTPQGHPVFESNAMATRKYMIEHEDVKHPMVAQPCSETFDDLADAAIQFSQYSYISSLEDKESTRLFCNGEHHAIFVKVDKMHMAVALKFGDYKKLHVSVDRSGQMEDQKYRLEPLSPVTIIWKVIAGDASKTEPYTVHGFVSPLPIDPSFSADAWIIPLGESSRDKYYQGQEVALVDLATFNGAPTKVKLDTTTPSSLFKSQMQTVRDMYGNGTSDMGRFWKPVILNQLHDSILKFNIFTNRLTADAEVKAVKASYDDLKMLNVEGGIQWTDRQRAAFDLVANAPNKLAIITGPAGTGKTLMQLKMVQLAYEKGFHVICLSPTNSTADRFATQLAESFVKDEGLHQETQPVTRAYPSNRNLKSKYHLKNVEAPKYSRSEGASVDNAAELATFNTLAAAITQKSAYKISARDLGQQAKVFAYAKRNPADRVALRMRFKSPGTVNWQGDKVDMWAYLGRTLDAISNDLFDWDDKDKVSYFDQALKYCTNQFITSQRLIVTTTGNSRSELFVNLFGKHSSELDMKAQFDDAVIDTPAMKGVLICIDECNMDNEINTWSAILHASIGSNVTGVICFGDDKQLRPHNLTDPLLNEMHDRGSYALPMRLIDQGYESVFLDVQSRMHIVIADFISKKFYNGELKTADRMKTITLDEQYKGLRVALAKALGYDPDEKIVKGDGEKRLRMAFIEVKGTRHVDPSTQSKLVVEPAAYFLKYCYGPLLELFKNKMSDNVLVVCAYSASRDWWLKLFQFDMVAANSKIVEANKAIAEENESLPDGEKKEKSSLRSMKHYPRVLTVDSAEGDEALVVFVDPGHGGGKTSEQGFIKDTQRCNVLLTRGKASVTVLGNPCDNVEVTVDPVQTNPPLSAYFQYCSHSIMYSVIRAANNRVDPKVPLVTASQMPPQFTKISEGDDHFTMLINQKAEKEAEEAQAAQVEAAAAEVGDLSIGDWAAEGQGAEGEGNGAWAADGQGAKSEGGGEWAADGQGTEGEGDGGELW
ncbi:hypothetical protein KC315_g11377 [Hortaea werneckii]|nr:hypothetical protein KC315_g11377 [Hortaea werneckii]KAI7352689.1 hypothetical protein KC354_g11886 [Hortaea werneckii]